MPENIKPRKLVNYNKESRIASKREKNTEFVHFKKDAINIKSNSNFQKKSKQKIMAKSAALVIKVESMNDLHFMCMCSDFLKNMNNITFQLVLPI